MKETIIGLTEKVRIKGEYGEKEVPAKIDTGSESNSMDLKLASKLGVGPIIKSIKVKSSHGMTRRPVVKARIRIKNRLINALFNIADRKRLKYKILIGRRTLAKNFLIDPSKK